MKIKIIKSVFHIFVLLASVFLICEIYGKYLDKRIEELYHTDPFAIDKANGLAEKDKGNVLLALGLQQEDLLMMGSSELSSPVPQNPKNLFPNNLYQNSVTYTGHAYVQNFLHAMNLGANREAIGRNDIVIVESLQWFTGNEADINGTMSNFSELQFYEFLQNSQISKENKRYLCKRFIEMEGHREIDDYAAISNKASENKMYKLLYQTLTIYKKYINHYVVHGKLDYPQTYILARLYVSDHIFGKAVYNLVQPYYFLRGRFMMLKDKFQAYKYLKTIDLSTEESDTIEVDWDIICAEGEKEGRTSCTNNDLYVYDSYYTKYLEDKYDSLENNSVNVPLMISAEWKDYEFFLGVCNELDLHPYVVIMSTNGFYYDYIGITKNKRDEYYDASEQISAKYGIECLNLKDQEYEPYFYCDVMHLGWKGWPYVCKKIVEHFSGQAD